MALKWETERRWRAANPEKWRAIQRRGNKRYAEKKRATDPEWAARRSAQNREWRVRLRQEAMAVYGESCQCCGEGRYEFLTIDHIYNDGAEHRRTTGCGGGAQLCAWLKRNGWPPGFRTLCFNCNSARQFSGECPHAREKQELIERMG